MMYQSIGFADPGTSSDFFENIYREYERKKRKHSFRTQTTPDKPSTSSFSSASAEADFRRRHAEGLRKRGLSSSTASSSTSLISYEQYTKQWQTFLQSCDSRAIPWPPVKVGDVENLLCFVGRNLVHLRQLQVDWHPDRFFARLPSTIPRTEAITSRVTALSQFFNAAVAELRTKGGRTE